MITASKFAVIANGLKQGMGCSDQEAQWLLDRIEELKADNEKYAEAQRGLLAQVAELIGEKEEMCRRIEALEGALKWIDYHYENQDMSHVDFRVEAKTRAVAALSGTEPGE